MKKSVYDAVIIGSGVIGNSVATELSRAGFRTLNIEKLGGAGRGSTGYSSGICRMMYSIVESVKFAWDGYTYYENWAAHIGCHDPNGMAYLRETGGLVLRSESSSAFLDSVVASHAAVGLPYEEWDAATIRERYNFDLSSFGPPVRIDHERFGEPQAAPLTGGVFFPMTGYVSDPGLAARNLQTAAEATGKTITMVLFVSNLSIFVAHSRTVLLRSHPRSSPDLSIFVSYPAQSYYDRT